MTTLDDRVRTAVDELVVGEGLGRQQRDLVISMFETVVQLAQADSDTLDLKIVDTALEEMAEAFKVFRPWRAARKVTMFGSARTAPDDPIYVLARDLARQLATEGWMIVTGAGPGIMAAGTEGAGRDLSFGVNIRLPHEQGANAFIAQDPKLVEMRYFFTRKLMLIKESHAYVVLPGGFGTLDECFELLTLLQTGKAEPAPVVLVETPGEGFWRAWLRFVEEEVVSRGYVSLPDLGFFRIATSAHEAAAEIQRLLPQLPLRAVGRRPFGAAAPARLPDDAALDALSDEFSDILRCGAHPGDQAPPTRALRGRPPRARAGGAALRQVELRAASCAHRRAERVLGPLAQLLGGPSRGAQERRGLVERPPRPRDRAARSPPRRRRVRRWPPCPARPRGAAPNDQSPSRSLSASMSRGDRWRVSSSRVTRLVGRP